MSEHPSVMLQAELTERGWTLSDLVVRSLVKEYHLRWLTMQMYLSVGPTTPGMEMGADTAEWLSDTMGVDRELFPNMERRWRDTFGEPEA